MGNNIQGCAGLIRAHESKPKFSHDQEHSLESNFAMIFSFLMNTVISFNLKESWFLRAIEMFQKSCVVFSVNFVLALMVIYNTVWVLKLITCSQAT